jgi:hypothetical protein
MATLSGPVSGLAEMSRIASESVDEWLREYEGYRGLLVFTDEAALRSRVVTLWDTPEDEEKARTARGAMRDQIIASLGGEVVDFGVFEVAVLQLPS